MQLDVRQAIYLGALLHDIGKFWQRSEPEHSAKKSGVLSSQTFGLMDSICPTYDGRPAYKHVLWTNQFFETYREQIMAGLNLQEDQVANIAAKHHMPLKGLTEAQRAVALADKLSSGQDRRSTDEMLAEEQTGSFRYKKQPLRSIFDNIYREQLEDSRYYGLKLSPLTFDKKMFPVNLKGKSDDNLQPQYAELWKKFSRALANLPVQNFTAHSDTLLSLLETYTWSIPSSTIDQPDISLYDHLKTTAALAVCLYDSIEEHGALPQSVQSLKEEEANRFSVWGIDLSGIQNFIYQISSKGAAKTLKGRSFYLEMILDLIWRKISQITGGLKAQLLFSGGGRMYVVMPNTEGRYDKVRETIRDLNIMLHDTFNGTLSISLAHHEFPASTLFKERGYADVIEQIQGKLERDKYRRFADTLANTEGFFEPQDQEELKNQEVCSVTGADIQGKPEYLDEEVRENPISLQVKQQIDLGKDLRNSSCMAIIEGRNAEHARELSPLDQNVTYKFLRGDSLKEEYNQLLKYRDEVRSVIWFNEPEAFIKEARTDHHFSSTWMAYGGRHTPRLEEDGQYRAREFNEIAEDNANNDLGILRMDVDNLGKLFKYGFNGDGEQVFYGSISRYSTLSSRLGYFFGGFLDHLFSTGFEIPPLMCSTGDQTVAKQPKRVPDFVYPVYSGGDDLFVVTRWDIAPVLAQKIRDDFRHFTGDHPAISISGGCAVVSPKYPIHRSAQLAGDAEEAAKKLVSVQSKDAFTYFDTVLGWSDFALLVDVLQDSRTLLEQSERRSLIRVLRSVSDEFHPEPNKYVLHGPWRWRTAYQIARLGEQYSDIKQPLNNFASHLFSGKYRNIFEVKDQDDLKAPERTLHNELVDLVPLLTRWLANLTRNQT